MPMGERMRLFESTGGDAGLVRVDVLAPPSGRDEILPTLNRVSLRSSTARAMASRLRGEHRGTCSTDVASPAPDPIWGQEHDALYDEAVRRFGTLCMWHAKPGRSVDGLHAIAGMLETNGGMDAWRHAARIREVLHRAS